MVEASGIHIAEQGDPEIKILTYKLLKQINESSVKAGRNRTVYFDRLPITDDGTMYPVTMSFVHNDVEMRTEIILNGEGEKITLDMGFYEFNALPTLAEILNLIKIAGGETDA